MGSFSLSANSRDAGKPPSPLSVMRGISATCNVTNRIDIDKYFEALKLEVTKTEKTDKSSKRVMRRSASSSKIEGLKSPSNNNTKRKVTRKLSSQLESSNNNEYLKRSTRKSFNYDLSGQIINKKDINEDNHCLMSRQKSWDLSSSKIKVKDYQQDYNNNNDVENNNCENKDLASSYSAGDFCNSKMEHPYLAHSKSLENNLHLRHHEHAIAHGKIYSVSEQNRRHRRRYYRKKKNSDEKEENLHESLDRKLSLS